MPLALGNASVTIINVGHIAFDVAGYLHTPGADLGSREDLRELREQRTIPIQCIHIRTPESSVLVDAGRYDAAPGSEYHLPGYQPPGSLEAQLIALAIRPSEIEHVVITHRHWDHFNGTTCLDGDLWRPTFPRARYYLGRADWELAAPALADPDSLERRTLGVLHSAGALTLVEGELELGPGITVRAAPGETPGHQVVRVRSGGQAVFCLGDLYHHPVEVTEPTWMVRWADPETAEESRRGIVSDALASDALLVSTHIPGVGRLRATGQGLVWVSA